MALYPHGQVVDESAVRPDPTPCLPWEDEEDDENWVLVSPVWTTRTTKTSEPGLTP
jgi:hypothetical protein